MTQQELDAAYKALSIARQSSHHRHKIWCAIMDAFCEFLEKDADADKAAEIADKYTKIILSNGQGVGT